jgi:hypothetical protein
MQPQGTAVTPPPVATLVAITEEATHALGGRSGVPVTTFPFRVGRERRVGGMSRALLKLGGGSGEILRDIHL